MERVLLLHGNDFGKVGAEPLRVEEVEITEETAVIKMEEDSVLVQEGGSLVQLIHLLTVAMVTQGSSGVGREGGREGEREREREKERERMRPFNRKHIHMFL